MFTLSFHVEHIRTEYSRSNLRTRSSQKVAAKHFCRICRSEGRPKYSAALFSDVGLCEDWRSRLCKLLLMSAVSVDSGDGLHAVPARVGEVKPKLRALMKQVPDSVASFQTP